MPPLKCVTIKKLTVEGFLSYRDPVSIDFDKGVTAIIGENGAGKTSLIEAIYFALTGQYPRRASKDRIINNSSNRMRVELVLETPEGEARIMRERARGLQLVQDIIKINGRVIARSKAEVNAAILKLLLGKEYHDTRGIDNELNNIMRTIIIRQGELLDLVLMLERSSKEKKELIDNIFGISDYEKVYEKLKDYELKINLKSESTSKSYRIQESDIRRAKEDLKTLDRKLTDKRKELEKEENELRRKKEELERKKKEEEILKTRLDELRRSLKQLEEEVKQFNEITGVLASFEATYRELKEKIEKLNKEVGGIKDINIYKNIKDSLSSISKSIKYKIQVNEVIDELEYLGEHLKKLVESSEKLSKYLNTELLFIEGKKFIDKLSRLYLISSKIEDTGSKLLEKQESINRNLESIITSINNVFGVIIPFTKDINSLINNTANTIRDLYEKISKAKDEAKEKLGCIKTELSDIEDKIKRLNKAKGKCPLCGHELTEEHRRSIINEYVNRKNELYKELEETRKKLREIEYKVKEIREIDREFNRVKSVFEELQEKESMLKNLRCEIESLKIIVNNESISAEAIRELLTEAGNLLHSRDSLMDRILKFKKLIEKAETLRLDLSYDKMLDLCSKHKFKELSNLIHDLMTKLSMEAKKADLDISSKLELLPRELREKIQTMPEQELLDYISEKLEDIDQKVRSAEKLEELVREAEELKEEIKRLRESIERRKGVKDEYEKLKNELESISEKLREAARDIGELEGRVRKHEELINKLRKEVADLEQDIKTLEECISNLEALYNLRIKIFHRDTIPRKLRSYAIRFLEEELNNIIEQFELNYTEASINENLDIMLLSPRDKIELSMASGGEKVVFAISFILALQRAVQAFKGGNVNIGFLIVDEPTIFLDQDRRSKLVSVLTRFKGGRILPQLIIVTHDEDLREASDSVYVVKRTISGSKVYREEVEETHV